MPAFDETTDFVVVGSGGGSMMAALAMADAGRRCIILEKTDKVGGSTAMSGGVFWIPNHPLQAEAGVEDSAEMARTYLDAVVGDVGPSTSPERKEMFLRMGPKMVSYLRDKGMPFLRGDGWSDYHDDMPGSCPRSRSLLVEVFDANELGEWEPRLRRGPFDIPVRGTESRKLQLMKKSWAGKAAAVRLGLRMLGGRLTGRKLVGMGAAIQGRMLQMALRHKADIRLDSPVSELIGEDGRIVGVQTVRNGKPWKIGATSGVLINAGGFSHNAAMRAQYGLQPSSVEWTNANPGDTGEMIEIARRHGAATDLMDQAVWLVTSLDPGGARAFHVLDLPKAHSMMVNKQGNRFANEAQSYMANGQAIYAQGSVPSWVILESRHRDNYPWGVTPGGKTPQAWLDSGYMKKADSIADLAVKCGLPAGQLEATVERFNGFCRTGRDLDFGRGGKAYDLVFTDPGVKPNPSLGEIRKPPFYAVEVFPGDVGTYGGLVTDQYGRVLQPDDRAIPGLYATGNSTASVTGKTYPGAGASIAASFIFGWVSALHALGRLPD